MEFDDDLTACADLVRRADPDRFLATMAAPVAARAVLFPLYAFNAQVARAPWVTQEVMIAKMRLQWWHDVLDEIASGAPVRRHEVATPLARVLDREGAELLKPLVAARRWDVYRDPFADQAAVDDYLAKTSGHLMWVAARALGAGQAAAEMVLETGQAQGLGNFLAAVPALERAGRIPLVDGRPEAVKALAERGLQRLRAARRARPSLEAQARPAVLPAWKTAAILRRAAHKPARVAQGGLDLAPFRSRLALLFSASTGRCP